MFDLFLENFLTFFNALEQVRQKCRLGKKLSEREVLAQTHNLSTKEAAVEGPTRLKVYSKSQASLYYRQGLVLRNRRKRDFGGHLIAS